MQAFNHLDKADTFDGRQDRRRGVDASDYDGLVLPGGVANPDFLRTDEDAVAFVRAFFEQAKPVGVICHGPWTLVEADVVRGRTLTSWPSLQTDLAQRGRDLGRRGGPRRRGPDELAQPGRPAGVLRQARRGVRRGQARRPGLAASPSAWPRRSWTSTARWWTRTTTTRSPGSGRSGSTASSCRCGASTGTSGWAATSWSPPSPGEGFDREQGDDVRAAEKVLYARADRRGRSRSRARAR